MSRNKIVIAGLVAVLLLVGIAAVFINRSASVAPATISGPAGSPASGRAGLAESADKVSLTVAGLAQSNPLESEEIVLTLDIAPGWHVNANPASMEFLIPTVASGAANGSAVDLLAQYPAGRVSDITLGDTAIEVYDDGVQIRLLPKEEDLALVKEAGELDLSVRVQACSDEGVCLAPSDLSVTLDPATGQVVAQ